MHTRDNQFSMTSQAFLWVNIGIGAFLLILFWFGRSRVKEPSRLRLKGGSLLGSGLSGAMPFVMSVETRSASQGCEMQKSLNIIFMHNGHSFDAYEVLGVPAGARYEIVLAAYERALGGKSPDVNGLIETAFRVIRDHSFEK